MLDRLLAASVALSLIAHLLILQIPDFRVPTLSSHESAFKPPIRAVFSHQEFSLLDDLKVSQANAPSLDVVEKVPVDEKIGFAPPQIVGRRERIPVLSLSVDDYLPPSRLDRIPKILNVLDTVSNFEIPLGLIGDAEILLLISSSGEVDNVLLLDSSLPAFVVDELILRFREAGFEPGEKGSWKVRSRLRIRLHFPEQVELLGNPSSVRIRASH